MTRGAAEDARMSRRITKAEWKKIVEEAYVRSAAEPLCPRCVDVTPGEPCGYPDLPHPGPFDSKLCAACDLAVERQR
jgi:hypothetical protein